MTIAEHLAAFDRALSELIDHARAAGAHAPVPPCPGWTVLDLLAHQGAVHRWATGAFAGEDLAWEPLEQECRDSADPLAWLADGAARLRTTLVEAADDAVAVTFLKDAPAPRAFWTRRQAHETTMHAVDALAARTGALPTAAQTWLDPGFALDGVDELILGFLPRSKTRIRSTTPVRVAVHVTDAAVGFTLDVHDAPPIGTLTGPEPDGDLVVRGTAVQLYLALWHRSEELADSPVWPLWHDTAVL